MIKRLLKRCKTRREAIIGAAISAAATLVLAYIAYFHSEAGIGLLTPLAALLFLGYLIRLLELRGRSDV